MLENILFKRFLGCLFLQEKTYIKKKKKTKTKKINKEVFKIAYSSSLRLINHGKFACLGNIHSLQNSSGPVLYFGRSFSCNSL